MVDSNVPKIGDVVSFQPPIDQSSNLATGQIVSIKQGWWGVLVDPPLGYSYISDLLNEQLELPPNKNLMWIHPKQFRDKIESQGLGQLKLKFTTEQKITLFSNMKLALQKYQSSEWSNSFQNEPQADIEVQKIFSSFDDLFSQFLAQVGWDSIDCPNQIGFLTLLGISEEEVPISWYTTDEPFHQTVCRNLLQFLDREIAKLTFSKSRITKQVLPSITTEKTLVTQSESARHETVDNHSHSHYSHNKEISRMSNKPGFMQMVKTDGTDAAYRVGAKQMTRAVKTATTNVMKSKGVKKGQINAVASILDTDLGEALISMGLGTALNFIPGVSSDPRMKRLSKEFRVEGMAGAGNIVADSVATYLLPAIADTLKGIPEETEQVTESQPAPAVAEPELVPVDTTKTQAK